MCCVWCSTKRINFIPANAIFYVFVKFELCSENDKVVFILQQLTLTKLLWNDVFTWRLYLFTVDISISKTNPFLFVIHILNGSKTIVWQCFYILFKQKTIQHMCVCNKFVKCHHHMRLCMFFIQFNIINFSKLLIILCQKLSVWFCPPVHQSKEKVTKTSQR